MFGTVGKKKCLLCSEIADILPHQGLVTHLYCENCGEYNITIQAERVLEFCKNDIKYILSSQTFEKYYYEHEPLTLLADHIQNAKDITLLEKLYKLSRYLYYETKKVGAGLEVAGISYSHFFCKNNNEYLYLLETLKSMNIIHFEKFDDLFGARGTHNTMIGSPVLTGTALLAFEEGIETIENFKERFMDTKNNGNQFNFNLNEGKNQFNFAFDDANITTIQNNSLDINELNVLLENVFSSLPQNIDNEKRSEVKENLTVIRSEIQSLNPRKIIIKNTLFALKAIASTVGFLASLAKLAEYLNIQF